MKDQDDSPFITVLELFDELNALDARGWKFVLNDERVLAVGQHNLRQYDYEIITSIPDSVDSRRTELRSYECIECWLPDHRVVWIES